MFISFFLCLCTFSYGMLKWMWGIDRHWSILEICISVGDCYFCIFVRQGKEGGIFHVSHPLCAPRFSRNVPDVCQTLTNEQAALLSPSVQPRYYSCQTAPAIPAGGSASQSKRPMNESRATCESDSSQWAKKQKQKQKTAHVSLFLSPESKPGSARSWRAASSG